MEVIVVLIIGGLLGWWGSAVMAKKGRSPLAGFLLGFILGIIGVVICYIHSDKHISMSQYLENRKRLSDLKEAGTLTQEEYNQHLMDLSDKYEN